MYFVDREKIENTLDYIMKLMEQSNHIDLEQPLQKLSIERIVHMTIEAILDVGNSMIDGFIMRDPGSYEDIIDILLDEKVIDEKDAEDLKELIEYRKILVQDYLEINHNDLNEGLNKHKETIVAFTKHVKRYLDEELGPVSAFRN